MHISVSLHQVGAPGPLVLSVGSPVAAHLQKITLSAGSHLAWNAWEIMPSP